MIKYVLIFVFNKVFQCIESLHLTNTLALKPGRLSYLTERFKNKIRYYYHLLLLLLPLLIRAQACVLLQSVTAMFRQKDTSMTGNVRIAYEEFMTMCMLNKP